MKNLIVLLVFMSLMACASSPAVKHVIINPDQPIVVDKTEIERVKNANEPIPIHRMAAMPSQRAMGKRIPGHVLVTFDVNQQGVPENIQILESEPKKLYDKEVIDTLKKWRYEPMPQKYIGLKNTFRFKWE